MDPLSSLLGRLASLQSYWKPFLEQLSSNCEQDGTVLSLRTLLFAIRDMSYGRPAGNSNNARACINQWRGTCSAKHLAAYELLDTLALSPKLWLACYKLDFTKPYYSDELRSRAEGRQVHDVHNYLTCELNGCIKIIDITFPAIFGIYGLPVTESWTGKESFVLCCDPEETCHVGNIEDADRVKRDWLRRLNSRQALALREQAIHELMLVTKRG